jgi:hypothetical protein
MNNQTKEALMALVATTLLMIILLLSLELSSCKSQHQATTEELNNTGKELNHIVSFCNEELNQLTNNYNTCNAVLRNHGITQVY